MPSTAEILIKARDQFSKMTDQAKRDVVNLGKETKASMATAKDSADILKDTLGVQLPRELTKLIARSQLLGPALAASFNVIALLGFISAAGQIPALFGKIKDAVLGSDEAVQKAFKAQIDLANRLAEVLDHAKQSQVDLMVRLGMMTSTEGVIGKIVLEQKGIADSRAEIDKLQRTLLGRSSAGGESVPGGAQTPMIADSRSNEQITSEIERLTKKINDATVALAKFRTEAMQAADADDTAKWFKGVEAAVEARRKAAQEEKKHFEDVEQLRQRAEDSWFTYQMMLRKLNKDRLDAQLKDEQDAGDALIKHWQEMAKTNDFWADQAQDFRNRFVGGMSQDDMANNERLLGVRSDALVKHFNELSRQSEKFIDSFRDGAGRVWDDFFIRGQNVLTSLANLAKGLLNTIGRTLFQNFATGLFAGGSSGGGIGGTVGNVGMGLGSKFGLSALFGAGASAGSFSAPIAAGFIPALGFSAFPGATSAVTGATALSSGIGPIGGASLGALMTNPWTIGIAGGILAGIGLYKLFSHKTLEAPFTKDPFSPSDRTIFFYSGLTEALKDNTNQLKRIAGITPRQVVTMGRDGITDSLKADNGFVRDMQGPLFGETI